jgi:hypothetical protein
MKKSICAYCDLPIGQVEHQWAHFATLLQVIHSSQRFECSVSHNPIPVYGKSWKQGAKST